MQRHSHAQDDGGLSWDVGERPTVRMAYYEYPAYLPKTIVCHRDEHQVRLEVVGGLELDQERQLLRAVTGWASEKREVNASPNEWCTFGNS